MPKTWYLSDQSKKYYQYTLRKGHSKKRIADLITQEQNSGWTWNLERLWKYFAIRPSYLTNSFFLATIVFSTMKINHLILLFWLFCILIFISKLIWFDETDVLIRTGLLDWICFCILCFLCCWYISPNFLSQFQFIFLFFKYLVNYW